MMSRRSRDALSRWLMLGSLLMALSVLLGMLALVLAKGLPALRWSLLFQAEGGIANALLGTLCLAGGASFLALALGLPAALALQKEYTSSPLARVARRVLDVLWGTPSIVYGSVGFLIMMFFGLRASLLGGILALTMVMLPLMIRGMDEVLRLVPAELKETSAALGTTRFEMMRAVVVRQALPGLFSSFLLALGRGMGDAASVLFTAGYTDHLPGSLTDPVASLPLAIFFQIQSPDPMLQQRAYASALILLLLVSAINIISRVLEKRFTRHTLR